MASTKITSHDLDNSNDNIRTSIGAAKEDHTHTASDIGAAESNHTHSEYCTKEEVNSLVTPTYTYGTTDLVAGESELETGKLYFVYE